jgi:uncharacterized protein YbjT (DUF2867 family)
MSKKTALVVGATGLVGSLCLQELLKNTHYSRVLVVVRKPLELKHSKLKQLVVDFDHLEKFAKQLKAHEVYCGLGTTRKKSPTEEAYRKIDFEYVFKLARITAGNKAEKFLVVSSMGADTDSSLFYSRLKGEMEEAVSALNFKAVHIFRPSFIMGEKDRRERRPMEKILEVVLKPLPFLFVGPLRKYRPIQAQTIARAMVNTAQKNLVGVQVWESNQIEKLGSF